MEQQRVIKTVRLDSGREVFASTVEGKLCASVFSKRPIALIRQLREEDDGWTLLQFGFGWCIARKMQNPHARKKRKQIDPTEEEIEARKAEVRKSQDQKEELYEPYDSRYLQDKYLEIAHDKTFHDSFDDIRKFQREDHDQRCDCPYWEHDRRNPEF